jgi:predicted MFS family arabinose efflux permease
MANPNQLFTRTFRAFRYRDFRLMWMGACASTIGTFVQQFAQSWLVYDLTRSPFYLGLDLFLGQLPIVLFSLVGGVFADRLDRRKMLLASQYIQMVCAFLLAILFGFHVVKVWQILTLSFVVGVGQSFGGPAYSAILPTLVGPEDLSNAIAMNSIQFNLARVLGPAIGGLAYTTLGATWCFGLNGVSYLAVIASLFMIRLNFVPAKTSASVLSSMKEGIRFIRQRRGMSALVVLAFCTTLFGFSINGFLPVFVRDIYQKGPATYTLLLVWSGVGSICGALIVASLQRAKGLGRLTLMILALLGCFTFAGAAIMAAASLMLSLAQLITTDAMRGRVMSVYNLAFRAGIPLGALALGKLIPLVGVSKALAGSGVALTVISLVFLIARQDSAFRVEPQKGSNL